MASWSKGRGEYTVGGDEKERRLPSLAAALSLAQTLATRASEPRLHGVYQDGQEVAVVERTPDGCVISTRSKFPENGERTRGETP